MFLNPLGLLALTAVPAVVALHLYRRRFRPRVVSAVFLWQARDHVPSAGRKREPLRTSASFWCEVLAALALALAFAGPRGCGADASRHLVVVLDGSASMGAAAAGVSSLDRALEAIEERFEALPSGSRATVVLSGPRPEVIAGPSAFLEEASEALGQIVPGRARHDLEPAVALALQLSGGGEVLLLTDHFEPDRVPPEVTVVSVGASLANVAITAATRRAADEPDMDELHLELGAFGGVPARGELTVSLPEGILTTQAYEVAPSTREHYALKVPAAAGVLELRLPADTLPIDDVAYLAPPPRRSLRVGTSFPPDEARALGLTSPGSDAPDRWASLLRDARAVADPAAAHVVLAKDAAPAGDAWALVIAAPEGAPRVPLGGPFLIDKRHPLLSGVTLEGIVWSSVAGPPPPGAPLVASGDLRLLSEAQSQGRAIFTASLDLLRSTLVRSPDWPILLANLAELRRAALPGPVRTSLVVGEAFEFRAARPARYRFTGPGGALELDARELVRVDEVNQPGEYVLERLEEDGTTELCRVGWSFADPTESDLTAAGSGEREAEGSKEGLVQAGHSWTEVLLLSLALLLVAFDWLVLERTRRRLG